MILAFIGALLASGTTTSQMAVSTDTTPRDEPAPVISTQFDSATSVREYIKARAEESGVDVRVALAIASCESGFDPETEQSKFLDPEGPNGQEDSWGIWQINLFWNPSVTRKQAMDIRWSTGWAMKQLKSGFTGWSCYPKEHLLAEK